MLYHKITTGCVIQVFDEAGNFLRQSFVAGDSNYETEDGQPIQRQDMPRCGNEYHPFDMDNSQKLFSQKTS